MSALRGSSFVASASCPQEPCGAAQAWRYSINYGPEGQTDYAMVYDSVGHLVGNLKTHHAIQVVVAMNAPGDIASAWLDSYDKETDLVPLGHENKERGASTYNWRKSVVKELRALMSSGQNLADATPNNSYAGKEGER